MGCPCIVLNQVNVKIHTSSRKLLFLQKKLCSCNSSNLLSKLNLKQQEKEGERGEREEKVRKRAGEDRGEVER